MALKHTTTISPIPSFLPSTMTPLISLPPPPSLPPPCSLTYYPLSSPPPQKNKEYYAILFKPSAMGLARLELFEKEKDVPKGIHTLMVVCSDVIKVQKIPDLQDEDNKTFVVRLRSSNIRDIFYPYSHMQQITPLLYYTLLTERRLGSVTSVHNRLHDFHGYSIR